MSREPTDVLIAAYATVDPAKDDYHAVIDARAKIEGAVCVTRDHAGELHVVQTDHMAKKGAEVLGGVGLVIGLFAPPLLLTTTAIAAAAGAGLGELAHYEAEGKIEQKVGETLPNGWAALIVAYPRSSADGIDRAVTRAIKKAVGEADGKKVDALKKALAEAQEKMTQPAM